MALLNFFKKVKHLWKMYTSEEYRVQTQLQEGEAIWNRLDNKLPEAEGVTNKDRVRLRMFERMVEELAEHERKALNAWLVAQNKKLHDECSEHTSGREEEYVRKNWQIYSSHQEVVLKWLP